jgi:hypothetical protein
MPRVAIALEVLILRDHETANRDAYRFIIVIAIPLPLRGIGISENTHKNATD